MARHILETLDLLEQQMQEQMSSGFCGFSDVNEGQHTSLEEI